MWKLQDPGFDQGYGSERSPEDDYVPPIAPAISLEAYEAELRTVYPFINDGKFKLDIEQPQLYLQNLNFYHFNPMIKKLYSVVKWVVNTIDDTLKLTATCFS